MSDPTPPGIPEEPADAGAQTGLNLTPPPLPEGTGASGIEVTEPLDVILLPLPDEREAELVVPEQAGEAEQAVQEQAEEVEAEVEEAEPEPDPDPLEAVLDDFRDWFQAAVGSNGVTQPIGPGPQTIDLATLLGHFVALRQEVNLQTRAVRNQQDQNAETIRQLTQSVGLLERTQTRNEQLERQALEDKVRPLLLSLVELHDALTLAGSEFERTEVLARPVLDALADEPEPEEEPRPPTMPTQSFWSKWILSPSVDAALRASHEETHQALLRLHEERLERCRRVRQTKRSARRVQEALAALVTGYTMNVQRIERTFRRHGLEAIPAVGERFDPEQMEVVDTVTGSGRPAGEVVEEVRRGYRWNGRIFRFAQVKVARS